MWFLLAVEAISLPTLAHLWTRRPARVLRKLAFTPVVLVPGLGPLLYFSEYEPPPAFGPGEGPKENKYNPGPQL